MESSTLLQKQIENQKTDCNRGISKKVLLEVKFVYVYNSSNNFLASIFIIEKKKNKTQKICIPSWNEIAKIIMITAIATNPFRAIVNMLLFLYFSVIFAWIHFHKNIILFIFKINCKAEYFSDEKIKMQKFECDEYTFELLNVLAATSAQKYYNDIFHDQLEKKVICLTVNRLMIMTLWFSFCKCNTFVNAF